LVCPHPVSNDARQNIALRDKHAVRVAKTPVI